MLSISISCYILCEMYDIKSFNITQFQRKFHSRTYRNSTNGAILFPEELYSDVIALKSQIINILQCRQEYLHKIKDINIVYLQSTNCLGLIIYFYFDDYQSIYNEDLFTIFDKYFNKIRFIDSQCNKYWECSYLKCSYQFNIVSNDNNNVYFCEKCKQNLTFQHNPNSNHFYLNLSLIHDQQFNIRDFTPKERSCIKYKFLTLQQFNNMKAKHHNHQTNNNQNSNNSPKHHKHKGHKHQHNSPKKRKLSRSPNKHKKSPDPAQQEEFKKKNAITMSLFTAMSHEKFQKMSRKSSRNKPDHEQKQEQKDSSSPSELENEHELETEQKDEGTNDKPPIDWIDNLTLNNLVKWFDHKPGAVQLSSSF